MAGRAGRRAGGAARDRRRHLACNGAECLAADAGALLAEALLKQTPWNYYTSPIDKGGEGGRLIKSTMDHRSLVPTAAEAKGLLGGVLAGNTKHPLGLHLWVVSEIDTTNNTRRRLD